MSLEAQIQTLTATMQKTNDILLSLGEMFTSLKSQVAAQAEVVPAPAPAADAPAAVPEFDADGLPWDERIHASSKAINADGTWRRRKGVTPEQYDQIASQINPKQVPLPEVEPAEAPSAKDGVLRYWHNTETNTVFVDARDHSATLTIVELTREGYEQRVAESRAADPKPALSGSEEPVESKGSAQSADETAGSDFDTAPSDDFSFDAAPAEEPAKTYTLDDLRKLAVATAKAKGGDFVWETLRQFQAKDLGTLAKEDYAAFAAKLEA